ncbi:hypothetical protein TRE132_55220 [Pseudomonas chlororaphis subsp. aurantiaca]|uniref:hypothetical protein n=1 Tax=Pseudomonas chlororaphis TaxID=587753 RepID=UPI001BF130E4|nr:hypothetical protein TRE132_55220 [Pseudomonas chlororaphis subsp. aurantiaca]
MSELTEVEGFIKCLVDSNIPHTLALTGSTARGELRSNSGQYDYESDLDILCIVEADSIAATLSCKKSYSCPIPLILMSSTALNYPSNAVLSIAFDSLISNDLGLSKPVFTDTNVAEFISYQAQPLAYYASQLAGSTLSTKRRLYSKISITCLKLLYLTDRLDRRSFIYEHELKSHHFVNVDEALVLGILNRELPDEQLRAAAEYLEMLVIACPSIMELVDSLESTRFHFLDKSRYSRKIIEAVFLENNRLKRTDALFIGAA